MSKTNVDKYLDNETRNIYNTKTDNKVLDIKYGLTERLIKYKIKSTRLLL